jgi:ABC transporter ATM
MRYKFLADAKNKLPDFVEGEISTVKASRTSMFKFFWPYVYPKDRPRRLIMLGTLGLLLFSKGLNAYIPFVLREGINAASGINPAYLYSGTLLGMYALGRSVVTYTHETRNSMLSKLVQEAMKDVSTKVFSHLHTLDYTYHLTSTKTTLFAVGRSMKGVENILKFMLQHIIPTALEFTLASAVLIGYCGWPYLLVLGGTVSTYTLFTTRYSNFRQEQIKEQRRKNKAVDFVINESFMNYETVKAFNNEAQEKQRYNHHLEEQMEATIETAKSLAVLNTGQQLIYNTGLGLNLVLSVANVANGTMTVGDLVMIQTIFMQLAMPLNFLGVVYRELNESQLEMRDLFGILNIKSK